MNPESAYEKIEMKHKQDISIQVNQSDTGSDKISYRSDQSRESYRNPDDKIIDGFDGPIIITTHLISIHLISTRLQ
jgi:hypothetical protein